jgi:flagellar basal body-associated protein FliL
MNPRTATAATSQRRRRLVIIMIAIAVIALVGVALVIGGLQDSTDGNGRHGPPAPPTHSPE